MPYKHEVQTVKTDTFDIPKTPWELVARQRNVMRKLWNRDFRLDPPVVQIHWKMDNPCADLADQKRRVEDPEADVRYQLEGVRQQIECLKCSEEAGIPLANTPAFNLIHFGTAPLATAFGAEFVLRPNDQPGFEPAVHTPEEVMKLRKPNLYKDGILPRILERIQYYNEATRGEVILTPCDTAGPWSVATSIWHYEDMLEAIYTAPEAVHHLLDLLTESIIEWYNIQETYIGRWGRTHSSFSWPFLQRGIGIGDDCMVTVSPAIWEEFFLPYNNRLSREYGNLITYHCCMGYERYFESLIKTDGFLGFDAGHQYNDLAKIESALIQATGVWMAPLNPETQLEMVRRLRDKIGFHFSVSGEDRNDAVRKVKTLLECLKSPERMDEEVEKQEHRKRKETTELAI